MQKTLLFPIGFCFLAIWSVPDPCLAQEANTEDTSDETDLNLELLKSVQHQTFKVLPAERDAYYQILDHAAQTNPQNLKSAALRFQQKRRLEDPRLKNIPAAEFPTFVDLFQNFKRYHGRPVTLKGHVRRLIQHPSSKGERQRYEAWVFTQNSQTNPAVIVLNSIPKGMPMGDNLLEKVSVTGYFFKLYGYEARDTARLAPLILADELKWFPSGNEVAPAIPPHYYAIAVGVAVIALGLILWFLKRTANRDRQFSGAVLAQIREADADEVRESDLNLPEDL